MSLGRLLATGRSLVGSPSEGRYNVSSRNRLPKFGSDRNPFVQSALKPAAERASLPKEPPAGAFASKPVAPAGIASASPALLKKTQRIPTLAGATRVKRAASKVMPVLKRLQVLAVAWVSRVALFAKGLWDRLLRVRHKEPRTLLPRLGKPAVQTELSLDNVKVVRNDLEESDLEIVTGNTDTRTQVAPTQASPTPNRGPVPPALKKLTDRMLGVKLG